MAWTTSADPEGTFALADRAAERSSLTEKDTGVHRPANGVTRPLALATLAHLGGLVVIAPFAINNPLIAIPVAIGLAVSYLTLSHDTSTGRLSAPSNTPASAVPGATPENNAIFHVVSNDNSAAPQWLAPHTSQAPVRPVALLKPAEVSNDLRSDLMARVSHELRTPLNAVMGFSDLMGHQMFGPLGHPRYEEYVTHIRESSQKLLKSAEDTLAMTSLIARSTNRCEREPISLQMLCKDAKSAVAPDIESNGISCIIDIHRDIEVISHRRALRQALVNVLFEAITQARTGATVALCATVDLDRVALLVTIDHIAQHPTEEHRSLPICLARTLLELDGSRLHENTAASAPWSVLLSLDGAIQQELFAAASTM